MPCKNRDANGKKKAWYLREQAARIGVYKQPRKGGRHKADIPPHHLAEHEARIVAHQQRVQRDLERLGLLGRKD